VSPGSFCFAGPLCCSNHDAGPKTSWVVAEVQEVDHDLNEDTFLCRHAIFRVVDNAISSSCDKFQFDFLILRDGSAIMTRTSSVPPTDCVKVTPLSTQGAAIGSAAKQSSSSIRRT
jgi:hypothetical protein